MAKLVLLMLMVVSQVAFSSRPQTWPNSHRPSTHTAERPATFVPLDIMKMR